jgi:hypothetical protein
MNHDSSMTWPSSRTYADILGRRLQNVFRISAKPEHELRKQALELREEVSSTYRIQAAKGEWFPWPSTFASRGARELKEVGCRPYGMLGFFGISRGRDAGDTRGYSMVYPRIRF